MGHYFTNDEQLKSQEMTHQVRIRNIDLSFITDHGVFSKKGLDFGTRTLLESIPIDYSAFIDIIEGMGNISM